MNAAGWLRSSAGRGRARTAPAGPVSDTDADADLAKAVAEREVPLGLTHNRASVSVSGPNGDYWLDPGCTHVLAQVKADLRAQLEYAREQEIAAGVRADVFVASLTTTHVADRPTGADVVLDRLTDRREVRAGASASRE
ncbi:hypothetical protein OG988_05345 [Streptomyces zaomyceticus]|uniref:hypothetical protein n=1 Tax=Streptomyces zaomyceticus TaxID=68286 RepID=UPI00324CDEDA